MGEHIEQEIAIARVTDNLSDARYTTEGVSQLLGAATEATSSGVWLQSNALFVLSEALDEATANVDKAIELLESLRGNEAASAR